MAKVMSCFVDRDISFRTCRYRRWGLFSGFLKLVIALGLCSLVLGCGNTGQVTQSGGAAPSSAVSQATSSATTNRVRYDDLPDNPSMVTAFVAQGNKWNKALVTYYLRNNPVAWTSLDEKMAFSAAFSLWSLMTQLTFVEVSAERDADMVILFGAGLHSNCPYGFDGKLGVLAHTYYPPPNGSLAGQSHYDSEESWKLSDSCSLPDLDLVTVAAHEIGHGLGLSHSTDTSALMYPYYSAPRRYLSGDDIKGIQSLYGVKNFSAQEEIGDVLISYGVIAASGNGARNRIAFQKPYANTNYGVVTSGEHSSEHYYWSKSSDSMEIGTDESSRTLYYFVVGLKRGASDLSRDWLDVNNLRIRWGNAIVGDNTQVLVNFGARSFRQRPSVFVTGVHEGHVSAWRQTNTNFQLNNFSSRRELSWVAMGSRNDGTDVPTYYDSVSGLAISTQRIGGSMINFVETYIGNNVLKTVRLNTPFITASPAFAEREHGWDVSPWHVSSSQFDFVQHDASSYVATMTIGKVGN